MNYRELRRRCFANAAAMVNDSDLDSLFGDDLAEGDWERADKAQRDVVEFLRRYAGPLDSDCSFCGGDGYHKTNCDRNMWTVKP